MIAFLLACSPSMQAVAVANPLLSIERAIDRTAFEGVVAERVDAGGYAYLRIDDRWVVGLDRELVPGDTARVTPIGLAHGFHSARTGRTFDTLTFGVLTAGKQEQP